MKLKINESLNRLFESAEDLDDRAYRAYKERDLDFFSNLSDEELEELKELCQITKENPYGKPYDDEVFDAIAERVYTVHSGYNPDRDDTETFKDFDSAVSYAFKLYNKYGEVHFIPPKKVSDYGAVVTGSENPETDYDNIEEFSNNLKNFFKIFFHINESLKESKEYRPIDIDHFDTPDGTYYWVGDKNYFEPTGRKYMKFEVSPSKYYRAYAIELDRRKKEMRESLSDDRYEEIKSKTVQDSDGFWTDYTMYFDHNENKYVFVFGDKEMYSPEDGEFDWEEENPQAAEEWFDSYEGFVEDDLEESVETISDSPMYAYLVTSDMTGMTFAMIHPDKERVTNATGQKMFQEWLTQNHYDDETGEETEESRNAKDSMKQEGYYLGWDEVSFGDKDWVEITNWDWNDDAESNPTSGWTAEIDGNLIPLEIVGSYHTRF